MIKYCKILIIFYLLIYVSGYSQSNYKVCANPKNVISSLHKMSENTNTIESDFVQEKNLSILTKKIISKGHFYFKKENNIRWEYTEPIEYLIVISKNQIKIKDGEKVKEYDAQSNKMFEKMNNFILDCVQGKLIEREEEYKVEYLENKTFYLIKFVPLMKEMEEILSEIEIYFNKKDFTISQIKLLEQGEDFTVIKFLNKKINTSIADEVFELR